ncbi:hypothetical protein BRC84_05535 [Halobacteriales archaeon QS_1_68_44]|nr:MAG: hypothetical protein BRC84_05535 [Halobacteriales archaeon QS_1_68_44]
MSVDTDITGVEKEQATLGVDIELTGALVARAGARQGRVGVPQGSTVADAVRAWADQSGDHLRFALLEAERLRSDVIARRVSEGRDERLIASEPVRNGDTVRFEYRE